MNSSRRPSLLWRLFVIGGAGTATAVTVSDAAWDRWTSVFGDALPREAFRNIAVGTAGLHAVEAGGALFSARRNGLEKPGRWALSTLLWGFPVLRRLRKAKKAGAAPAKLTVAPTEATRSTKATKRTKPTKAERRANCSKSSATKPPTRKRSKKQQAARVAKIGAAAALAAKKAA